MLYIPISIQNFEFRFSECRLQALDSIKLDWLPGSILSIIGSWDLSTILASLWTTKLRGTVDQKLEL